MKYLLDTNILLEGLLKQEKAEKVRDFITNTKATELAITDFSLHSIGIVLLKLGEHELFDAFLKDLLQSGFNILSLSPGKMDRVIDISMSFNLDFDDAYQYAVAEEFDLVIVSFDKDFDRTPRKRKEPGDLLTGY